VPKQGRGLQFAFFLRRLNLGNSLCQSWCLPEDMRRSPGLRAPPRQLVFPQLQWSCEKGDLGVQIIHDVSRLEGWMVSAGIENALRC
jgi:hypothetical protein